MRETKFRAKTEKGFIYGSSKVASINAIGFAYEVETLFSLKDFFMIVENKGYQNIDMCTLLKDKKGIEIYEGDIVKFPIFNTEQEILKGEIVFLRGIFYISVDFEGLYKLDRDFVEIITNIYENSELVK